MTEPHWTGYVGMATGIIGAITGVAGAIMGYISYQKSNSLKSLDLRLELQKAENDFQSDISLLKERIEYADKSRRAVLAARGLFRSGRMDKWNLEAKKDIERIEQLSSDDQAEEDSYDNLGPKDLESKIVDAHRRQRELDKMLEKYNAAIQSDDNQRNHIREDARSRNPFT